MCYWWGRNESQTNSALDHTFEFEASSDFGASKDAQLVLNGEVARNTQTAFLPLASRASISGSSKTSRAIKTICRLHGSWWSPKTFLKLNITAKRVMVTVRSSYAWSITNFSCLVKVPLLTRSPENVSRKTLIFQVSNGYRTYSHVIRQKYLRAKSVTRWKPSLRGFPVSIITHSSAWALTQRTSSVITPLLKAKSVDSEKAVSSLVLVIPHSTSSISKDLFKPIHET